MRTCDRCLGLMVGTHVCILWCVASRCTSLALDDARCRTWRILSLRPPRHGVRSGWHEVVSQRLLCLRGMALCFPSNPCPAARLLPCLVCCASARRCLSALANVHGMHVTDLIACLCVVCIADLTVATACVCGYRHSCACPAMFPEEGCVQTCALRLCFCAPLGVRLRTDWLPLGPLVRLRRWRLR